MAALSCCAVANHVFITIFTAYQCKVYRVVARKVHPSLPRVGKNFRVQLSARKCHTMKHPWSGSVKHVINLVWPNVWQT